VQYNVKRHIGRRFIGSCRARLASNAAQRTCYGQQTWSFHLSYRPRQHMEWCPRDPDLRSFITIRDLVMRLVASVCNILTFESLDLENCRYIFRNFRSSTYIKVIGSRSRSRSQEQKASNRPNSS